MTSQISCRRFANTLVQFRPRYPADDFRHVRHKVGLRRKRWVADSFQDGAKESSHSFGYVELAVAFDPNRRRNPQKEEKRGRSAGFGHKRYVFPGQLFRLETAVPDSFGFNQRVSARGLENSVGLDNQFRVAAIRTETEIAWKKLHPQFLRLSRKLVPGLIGTVRRPDDIS